MIIVPARATWSEANQRFLMAHVARIRAALAQSAERDGTATNAAATDLVSDAEVVAARADLPAPAALERLVEAFGLSSFERDILVLCAAIELDATFADACGMAAGDRRLGHASFGLALAAFPDAHWSALSPAAPLRRWHLVEVARGEPLTTAQLRIDEWALHFLAGVAQLDERLDALLAPIAAPRTLAVSHDEISARIAGLLTASGASGPPAILLEGDDVADLRAIAAHACGLVGRSLWLLAGSDVPGAPVDQAMLARLIEREAAVGTATVLVDGADGETSRSRCFAAP